VFDGQEWTCCEHWCADLERIPRRAWQNPEQFGAQRVKQNARREVWRACLGQSIYYLKYYREDGWIARLKRLIRRPPCEQEWQGGLYARRAGIPAVVPVGYTTGLKREAAVWSLLVTQAVEPAWPLDEFWRQIEADEDDRRRRQDTAQLIELLADMIARAHQAGFEHLDMHAANILVQPLAPRRYRTLFVDLQSARLGVPVSDRAVVRNLAQLNQWFRRHSRVSQRLRLLRAYFRWRNEYEQAFGYGRPLGLSFRELVRALARAAERHARRLGAQRDRRVERDGRYFAWVRLKRGWRGMATLGFKHPVPGSRSSQMTFTREFWQRVLANPLGWFDRDRAQMCKDSHSGAVCRAVLAHPDGPLPVILKRPLARNWRRRLSQMLPPSRSLRAWRVGHALLHRHLPTPRPLAVLERRVGPLVLDSLLITEAIPGAIDLEAHLRRLQGTCAASAWHRHKLRLCGQLAGLLRQLDEHGFYHRDCKASNILVVQQPELRLLWIDLDGLRRTGPLTPRGRRRRALACLAVSLRGVPGLTRTDWLRLLKAYSARFGADARAWRGLWRELDEAIARRTRVKERHRQWKLKHYGRP